MANLIQAENFPNKSDFTDLPSSFPSSSPEDTYFLGTKIANMLKKGSIIALKGELGSGKTCFAKGMARGLGVKEELTSPTYTIISEYEYTSPQGEAVPFYHIDAYRLKGPDDFLAIGGEEILYGNGISIVEWSERIEALIPREAINIEIKIIEDDKRLIKIHLPESLK